MTILFDGRASVIGAGPWTDYLLGPWGETSAWAKNNIPSALWAPRRCTLVTDPLGIKGQVIRSEILAGDRDAISYLTDSKRSELSYTSVLLSAPNTYWISWSTLFRSSWVQDNGTCATTVWQLHDTLDAGDAGRRPVLAMEVDADLVTFINGYTHSDGNETVNTVAHPQPYRRLTQIPLQEVLDTWQDWVVKIKMSNTDGSGSISLWRNRRCIFSDIPAGPRNCGNDVLGSFVTCGVYCPVFWAVSGIVSREAYTTGVRVGDDSETFASISGTTELERVTPLNLMVS